MIKTHKELAGFIKNKKILLMNSYGKDSIVCLKWLHDYAEPSEIVSLNMKFLAPHPKDEVYLKYLKKRFPIVDYRTEVNPFDISNIMMGKFQSPFDKLMMINGFDHDYLESKKYVEQLRLDLGCDYVCVGRSKYESFDRASFFYKNGLVKDNAIYPIGLMTKKEVLSLIDFKLHPI